MPQTTQPVEINKIRIGTTDFANRSDRGPRFAKRNPSMMLHPVNTASNKHTQKIEDRTGTINNKGHIRAPIHATATAWPRIQV